MYVPSLEREQGVCLLLVKVAVLLEPAEVGCFSLPPGGEGVGSVYSDLLL